MDRKTALERLSNLLPPVEEHLEKIAKWPESQAVNHWRVEVRAHLRRMDAAVGPWLGRKTAAEWIERIAELAGRLGAENA